MKTPLSMNQTDGEQPINQELVPVASEQPAQTTPVVIDSVSVKQAEELLKRYKAGKSNLENRIIENEKWFKMQHWELLRSKKANPNDPEPASAWMFNMIANKHADAMDNYPEPNVLPRAKDDISAAKVITEILPVIHEQCEYEQTYSDMWWYKLKAGTGVTGVFWSSDKANGLGDIDIRKLDLLNLFWEPGVTNIQKSPNFFSVDLVDNAALADQYPAIKDKNVAGSTLDIAKYVYEDSIDTTGKSAVVDWYYKLRDGKRDILHYCKFVNGFVLYASQNDPTYKDRGYYDHGKYPFIFDVLFPEEGSPAGFGYIDICKSPQMYIDKLDQSILKHAVMIARPRYWARGDTNVNMEEFADLNKDFVHYSGNGDPNESLMPIKIPELSPMAVNIRGLKIDELKETSGNRDFSQGGTASGVTAASAIAALQEAGSKLSRDMIKSSFRSFAQVNYLCLELMRQFYTEPRYFRIVDPMGQMSFKGFSGQEISAKQQGVDFGMNMGVRVPIFDIKITSQKSSPFSTVAQNERAKEFYGMGFFRPDLADQSLAALEMMQFEGIENVRERIAQNNTLYKQVHQLSQLSLMMASQVDAMSGSQMAQQVAQVIQMQTQGTPQSPDQGETTTNAIGASFTKARNGTEGAARAAAAEKSTPKA